MTAQQHNWAQIKKHQVLFGLHKKQAATICKKDTISFNIVMGMYRSQGTRFQFG